VPVEFAAVRRCVFHFTLFIEHECAEIHRETALGHASHQRQIELVRKIVERGEVLTKVATSGFPMANEIKARILSALLTLINCRESMERAALRSASVLSAK
jgi:hypothetical protein